MSLADIQAAYYMVAATGVLLAAIYYVISLHNQNQTRQAQLFITLYSSITDIEFYKRVQEHYFVWDFKDFDDFNEKYGLLNNPEEYTRWHIEANFIESTAILVNRGLIPLSLVDAWVGDWFIGFMEKYKPIIEEFRIRYNVPRVWAENDMLIKKLIDYRKKHPPRLSP